MARLYADENFPFPVVERLFQLGHDVLTMQETGHAGQSTSDEDVLKLATEQRRALLTLNRKHFIRLHGMRQEHAGIIVCTFDYDFIGQAERIHEYLESTEFLSGLLIRINRPSP